jgi:hypothetical protein
MLTNPTLFTATFGLIARIDAWFHRRRQQALETYLATSQNVFELEARMRDLDRANPHPYY